MSNQISIGIVGIHQYRVNCIVGIYPEEREQEQTLWIDLKIKLDLSHCIDSQQMQGTVNYVQLAHLCRELAAQKNYFLLETFALEILDRCFQDFPIHWAWVRIAKPSAIPEATCAFVELERDRKSEGLCGHL